ncbi:response regulator [Rhodopirellula sp. P2]|uniref:response regulator n=1 Tax=Rhodopirellula sp. P2 TaxID=2127060 RepID=UPI002367B385|nr:response regulator [Rhodopirellula sp. P2]WDQ14894.1 response regulator [Rhodopirellula sp. P2]
MSSPTSSLRIVVADDESDIREYFEAILPRLGHQVVGAAEDGQQLVALCQQEHPDLVITDVMMPKMDGLTAAEKISRSISVPIIVVSSHEKGDTSGNPRIVDYLVKPISIADLEASIRHAVRV